MHAARHRAFRELGAMSRQLADHWESLAGRMEGSAADVLRDGATVAREVLAEVRHLARGRDLEIGPAALGAGRVARARPPVADTMLERNQALRFAVLDVQHVMTLLGYLGELSTADDDAEARAACDAWAERLRGSEEAARREATVLGATPDSAIEPVGPGQRLGYLLGWLGEKTDRLRAGG